MTNKYYPKMLSAIFELPKIGKVEVIFDRMDNPERPTRTIRAVIIPPFCLGHWPIKVPIRSTIGLEAILNCDAVQQIDMELQPGNPNHHDNAGTSSACDGLVLDAIRRELAKLCIKIETLEAQEEAYTQRFLRSLMLPGKEEK